MARDRLAFVVLLLGIARNTSTALAVVADSRLVIAAITGVAAIMHMVAIDANPGAPA